MKQLLRNLLLTGALFIGCSLFAEEPDGEPETYIQHYDHVQKWINKQEKTAGKRSLKEYKDKLAAIDTSAKLDKEKIRELQKAFPKCYIKQPLVVKETISWRFHDFDVGWKYKKQNINFINQGTSTTIIETGHTDSTKSMNTKEKKWQDEKEIKANLSASASISAKASGRFSMNPLKNRADAKVDAEANLSASGSYRYERGDVGFETTVAHKTRSEVILTKINQYIIKRESSESELENPHLSFVLTINNNSDEDIILSDDENGGECKVFVGNKETLLGTAKPKKFPKTVMKGRCAIIEY